MLFYNGGKKSLNVAEAQWRSYGIKQKTQMMILRILKLTALVIQPCYF